MRLPGFPARRRGPLSELPGRLHEIFYDTSNPDQLSPPKA
jgi:hypothetical protein